MEKNKIKRYIIFNIGIAIEDMALNFDSIRHRTIAKATMITTVLLFLLVRLVPTV